MRRGRGREYTSISTVTSVVIVVVVLAVALFIGAIFLMPSKFGGVGTTSTSLPIASTTSSSTTSSSTSSASTSLHGTVNYSPSCFPLYTQGGVHVFGTVSPAISAISGNVKSVKLYWRYHGQNEWTWLNDLTYGPSFSSDGNFSHSWNPPEAAYYDFEANWTLSNGQVITGITSQPFQVVAQESSCS